LLLFIYVYFFESGLFKGLRPIQTKNFRRVVSGCVQTVSTALLFAASRHALPRSRFRSDQQKYLAHILDFEKQLRDGNFSSPNRVVPLWPAVFPRFNKPRRHGIQSDIARPSRVLLGPSRPASPRSEAMAVRTPGISLVPPVMRLGSERCSLRPEFPMARGEGYSLW
jgi:hypothetical protein